MEASEVETFLLEAPPPKRLRDKVGLVGYLVFGVLATVGGWWFLLSIFDLAPAFPPRSWLGVFLGIISLGALFSSLFFAGPFIIYDSVKNYKEGEK